MPKKQKDQPINKSFDFILCVTVLIMLGLGLVMVLSASSPSALAAGESSYFFVSKQAVAAVIGITAMLVISKIDYKKYEKFYKVIYVVSVLILLLVLVPGLGRVVNGARRWISVPIIGSAQPSEITKIGLIVFYAAYLSKRKDELKSLLKGFFKPLLFLIPVIRNTITCTKPF